MVSFACLAPHGWLAVPLLCGPEDIPAHATREGLETLGKGLAEAAPETIVLMSPHGLMVEGAISILDSSVVEGSTEGMPWAANSRHSLRLAFEVDTELNAGIAAHSHEAGIPVLRVANNAAWEPLLLDFGALIPLWYAGATLQPRPKVVILSPDRRLSPIDLRSCIALGRAVRETAATTGRRIAFVASGDLAHSHDADHAYGYDPAAAEWDAAVVDAVRSGDLASLLSFDNDALRRAKTDAFGPLMCLYGLLEGSNLRGELLSYEAPTYFGMACAAWTQREARG
ncbi:MAG TPA: hypothetical protein VGM51_14415 [Armatimonadota bacterium]